MSPVRPGCARRPQAVPEGDEREGANLEQPDSGEAGGAPCHFRASSQGLSSATNPAKSGRIIRFRVDRQIAERAHQIVSARRMELPNVRA